VRARATAPAIPRETRCMTDSRVGEGGIGAPGSARMGPGSPESIRVP
jgi:hypothetical protein